MENDIKVGDPYFLFGRDVKVTKITDKWVTYDVLDAPENSLYKFLVMPLKGFLKHAVKGN